MSDYTAREIEEAPEARHGVEGLVWSRHSTVTLRGERVDVEKVAEHGGEGEGSSIWFVVKIGDQLFRKSGYYASHYGTDWDGDFVEVRAEQRMVTFYEAA